MRIAHRVSFSVHETAVSLFCIIMESPLFEKVRNGRHYKAEHLFRSTTGNYRRYLILATMLHSHPGKWEGVVLPLRL